MSPDLRSALLVTAQALPPGTAVPVVRETLIELLAGSGEAPADAPPPDLTVAQVAARFNRNPSTVRGWIASGQLAGAYRFQGRELRVPVAALDAFEAAQRGPAAHPTPRVHRSTRKAPDLGSWRKLAS